MSILQNFINYLYTFFESDKNIQLKPINEKFRFIAEFGSDDVENKYKQWVIKHDVVECLKIPIKDIEPLRYKITIFTTSDIIDEMKNKEWYVSEWDPGCLLCTFP